MGQAFRGLVGFVEVMPLTVLRREKSFSRPSGWRRHFRGSDPDRDRRLTSVRHPNAFGGRSWVGVGVGAGPSRDALSSARVAYHSWLERGEESRPSREPEMAGARTFNAVVESRESAPEIPDAESAPSSGGINCHIKAKNLIKSK